jgi:hypothetical protein
MTDRDFRKLLSEAILERLKPQRRVDLPELSDALGLPPAPRLEGQSKAEYIKSRLGPIQDDRLDAIAEAFVAEHPFVGTADERTWKIQELLWVRCPGPPIPKKYRNELARRLEKVPLFLKGQKFLEALRRLWVIDDPWQELLAVQGGPPKSLARQIERHVVQNEGDWSVEYLFERLGAFDVSDRRFGRLLEALASPEVRPDEEAQRTFVGLVNAVLVNCGIEMRETGSEGGYPVFSLAVRGAVAGRPKNLIFASSVKPDIRFRDAVNNDIEVASNADKVLVYDRSIPPEGLRWRDLQGWWQETSGCDADTAKKTLYVRLMSSLPTGSPPQRLFFRTFFKVYGPAVPGLPALLPEVWLHWDPKTVQERGPRALLRFRMDFLMLLPASRIVVEVDGLHHFSDAGGRADAGRYSQMMTADRDLRLAGYEVYRFGASELLEPSIVRTRVKDFFDRLFRKHGITV